MKLQHMPTAYLRSGLRFPLVPWHEWPHAMKVIDAGADMNAKRLRFYLFGLTRRIPRAELMQAKREAEAAHVLVLRLVARQDSGEPIVRERGWGIY